MGKNTQKTIADKQRKTVREQPQHMRGQTIKPDASTDCCKQEWLFHSVVSEGPFGYSCNVTPHIKEILEKVAEFSKLSWAEIKGGNGKHHLLTGDGFSDEAKTEIDQRLLPCDTDRIFSMRMNGNFRIIGLRDREHFIVKWIDPDHQFYPSQKKHT